jgi:PQQ enzyme repeat
MERFVANAKLPRKLLLLLIPTLFCGMVGGAGNGGSTSAFDYRRWETSGGDKGVSHYSELDQINRTNVHQLQVAWIYNSSDVIHEAEPFWGGSTIQCNPIIVDGTMYTTTPTLRLVAVDATNGKEIWRFDPHKGAKGGGYNRGVAYWRDKEQRRLFFGVGPHLYAVDAITGKPVDTFGQNGRVLMGTGSTPEGETVSAPAAPVVYRDLVIVGEMSSTVPGNVTVRGRERDDGCSTRFLILEKLGMRPTGTPISTGQGLQPTSGEASRWMNDWNWSSLPLGSLNTTFIDPSTKVLIYLPTLSWL